MKSEFYDIWSNEVDNQVDFAYGLQQLEAEIRAEERTKTIDEVIHELKHRNTTIYETGYMCHEYSDNELDEVAEQMKGEHK